jgi:hypothetical protein
MSKSRNRKNHKAKVAARNEKINQQKKKVEKLQREFIMNLIKQEQEKGLFDNNPTIEPVSTGLSNEGPTLDIEGPII